MSKSQSLFSALLCTLIWGTTFIAQDTGMDAIGPFIFNATRFFVGFLVLIPFFFLLEFNKFSRIFNKNKKKFIYLSIFIGIFLFLASALQQISLLYTDVANAAFFTIFYVPMVPIIVFILFRKKVHWSVWPSVILCVMGGYLLTDFYDATVRMGDLLVILGALFWSLHIIFIGEVIYDFDLPIAVGLIQTFIVSFLSYIIGISHEQFIFENILNEKFEILYAGVLSGGFAFVLQIYAQKNINPAPAAIIFSLEGVFATIAAWFILNQILNINNILGCLFILSGVLLSQLVPKIKKV
jgi:drug/metabolite transporter (DMT)-like permease